ncbi:MAG: alpha-2-macroglobulin family protein, partial [Verrucomicrobiia bacterium]
MISAIGLAAYAMMQAPPPLPDGDLIPMPGEELAEVPGVKLTPINSELPARATFRVQFEETIVEPEQVGQSGQINPLVFEPPMKGEFIWDSTRSGSFTPASGFDLDARFVVSLSAAITGKTGLKFRRHYHTPPMQVEARRLVSLNSERPFNAAMAFNVAMDAANAENFVEFRAENGELIPASIESMTDDNHRWLEAPNEPWSMRMADEEADVKGRPTRIVIRPKRILSPSTEWQLLLKKGMPSGDGNRFPESVSYPLGMREPMLVEKTFAENRLNHGRSIRIRLSHALPPELTEQQLAKWLIVEQPVEVNPKKPPRFLRTQVEFTVNITDARIELKGDFELNQQYRVRMKPGLPSKLGLTLAKESLESVVFKPLPSRVYLPGTYFSQAADGNREFSFVSVNNRAIRLRVKRIAPEQLMTVLEVYRDEYLANGSFNWSGHWGWRDGQALSFDLIPGTQVCDRVFNPKAAVDGAVKKEFVWDELLGNDTPGPLFVSIECVGRDGTVSSAQVIAQLTDVGLTWKEADGEIHVQAFSLRTAKPLAGAKVQILGSDNQPRVTGRTDLDGRTVLLSARERRATRWLSVSHGKDHHTIQMDLSFAEIPLWPFNINYGWGNAETRKTHLFTDRLIYQPGDIVQLKGHVRNWSDGKMEVPAGETLTVRARDWRGHTFFSKAVTVSEHGSFDAKIQLAKGVNGSATIWVGGQYHHIDVFEYEPATFKLRFTGRRQFAPGEAIGIPMNASFYFGKPLAGAKAFWSFTGHHTVFSPTGWGKFEFGETDGSRTTELSGEGTLSREGQMLIRPEVIDDLASPMPVEGSFSVRITSGNGQSISGSTSVIRHSSDYYLALRELPRVRWAKQSIPLQVVAVESDGSPAVVGQSFTATLNKMEWHSVKMKGAGGVVRYKNERKKIHISETDLKTIPRDADPIPSALVPPEAGQYQLELRGADAKGRPIRNTTTFYVRGEKPLAWDFRNEFQMEMVPDRAVYQTGGTATILLKAPFSGRAMVTVEREKVLRSFSVNLTGNAPAIEVPLREGDAPNVFVSVMLLRGLADSTRKIKTAEYRIGYCELKVERPSSRLNVEAKLSQSDYQPGEEVEVALVVNDHNGAPVSGTEVTLYAVDEGILDLTGYEAPDLHSFFYSPRTLQVDTSTSFAFMRTEDPSRVAFGNKGHIIGGGGDTGKLRRKFLAVAFWNATLRTDADGRMRASFTAPDSLTRYRLFAVAHSGDRFGTVETGFRIHQPLMVESALPRFGRVGDQLTAKAMVYNQTDQPI